MFDFLHRSAPHAISDAIAQAIKVQGHALPHGDPARLRMVQRRGLFSDRKVTYFRIFDPVVIARYSLDIQRYRDLDAFQGLVLHVGHVESDGNVVVMKPAGGRIADATGQRRAIRIFSPAAARPGLARQARASAGLATGEPTASTEAP